MSGYMEAAIMIDFIIVKVMILVVLYEVYKIKGKL